MATDILDGFIARRLKWESEFGARLDSLADLGSYAMAFWGMLSLEYAFCSNHANYFFIIIGIKILTQIVSIIRFQKFPSLHLYSNKFAGYVQGFFMLFYYMGWEVELYFTFMFCVTCVAEVEAILVLLFIPAMRSNLQGIYWMLKKNGRIA